MIPTLQIGQLGRALPASSGGASVLPGLILAESPFAYWRHAESSGGTMVDASPNARAGTYAGTPVPQAAIYSGGPTCMLAGSSTQNGNWTVVGTPVFNAITICTVFKPNSVTGIRSLICRDDGGTRKFQWRMNGTSMEWVKIVGGVTTSTRTGVFSVGVASMIAVTVSSSGTVTMYQNGVQLGATFSIAAADYGGAFATFQVGYAPGITTAADGYFSESALWNTDLSAATLLSFATAAGF